MPKSHQPDNNNFSSLTHLSRSAWELLLSSVRECGDGLFIITTARYEIFRCNMFGRVVLGSAGSETTCTCEYERERCKVQIQISLQKKKNLRIVRFFLLFFRLLCPHRIAVYFKIGAKRENKKRKNKFTQFLTVCFVCVVFCRSSSAAISSSWTCEKYLHIQNIVGHFFFRWKNKVFEPQPSTTYDMMKFFLFALSAAENEWATIIRAQKKKKLAIPSITIIRHSQSSAKQVLWRSSGCWVHQVN